MQTRSRQLFISGRRVDAADGRHFEISMHGRDEKMVTVAAAGPADAARALDAAVTAFPSWSYAPRAERAAALGHLHDAVLAEQERIATTMSDEQHQPLAEATAKVDAFAAYLAHAADETSRAKVRADPRADLRPILDPRTTACSPELLAYQRACSGLANGCTVVVQAERHTSLTALAVFEAFAGAGFPDGVVNLLTTDAPEQVWTAVLDHPARTRSLAGLTSGRYYRTTLIEGPPSAVIVTRELEPPARELDSVHDDQEAHARAVSHR